MKPETSIKGEDVVICIDDEDEIATIASMSGSSKSNSNPQSFAQPKATLHYGNDSLTTQSGFQQLSVEKSRTVNDTTFPPQRNRAAYFDANTWRFSDFEQSQQSVSRQPLLTTPQGSSDHLTLPSIANQLSQKCCSSKSPAVQPAKQRNFLQTQPDSSVPHTTVRPPPRDDDEDDYGEDDAMDDEEFERWMSQFAAPKTKRQKPSDIIIRNPPIVHPLKRLDNYDYNGMQLRANCCVELQDGDFMKILHIVADTSRSNVTVRGHIFQRAQEMNGLLDHRLNEVCWIQHVEDDDLREMSVQCIETRAVSEVVRRRTIRLTNQPFDNLSFRCEEEDSNGNATNFGVLVCRYRYVCLYQNARARDSNTSYEKSLHRLRKDECDKRSDNDIQDDDLRCIWRGTTITGGANDGLLPGEKEFLRQENYSHLGKSAWQSLKVPGGAEFSAGDPMKRSGVGSILFEGDLTPKPTATTLSESHHGRSFDDPLIIQEGDSGRNEDVEEPGCYTHGLSAESANPLSPVELFESMNSASNYYSAIEALDAFSLSQGSSSDAGKITNRKPFPEVIEIDAKVETSSLLGTLTKHYKGSITSTFTHQPLPKRKRHAKSDSPLSPQPPKRPRLKKDGVLMRPDIEDLIEHPTAFSKAMDHEHHQTESITPRSSGCDVGGSALSTSLVASRHTSPVIDLSDECANVVSLSQGQSKVSSLCSTQRIPKPCSRAWASPHTYNLRPAELIPSPMDSHKAIEKTKYTNSSQPHALPSPQKNVSTVQNLVANNDLPAKAKSISELEVQKKVRTLNHPRPRRQRYTFGDCFCGCGGMSRGAVNAGLRVNWGFDFDLPACQSYEMNNFGSVVYNVAADQFSNAGGDHEVDICHFSPPCQFFSDAHTHVGKDDERNTASLFAIATLLEKVKPRVATLEQASGLLRRHPLYFNSVINMFTSEGFSVRWRMMNCADFGLPQRRVRLFLIASCPGEPLPPFPKSTHSKDPAETGLKPWTTINEAINTIPPDWSDHDPAFMRSLNYPPHTGDEIAKCITTSGGQNNCHPSGTRNYTLREFANLQSFPLGQKFGMKGVRKQIGNAVPPIVATALLEEVKRSLMKEDGLL
ncbi:hypothetical protein ACLMJK_000957 [Lecanora helva]